MSRKGAGCMSWPLERQPLPITAFHDAIAGRKTIARGEG